MHPGARALAEEATPRPTRRRPGAPRALRRAARAIGVALACAATLPGTARAAADDEPPTGRRIMEWVDARDDGDHGLAVMEMRLVDRRGRERVRRLRRYSRDVGRDEQILLFFESPADVRDTGFLTYDYDDPDRDDDQWLYLPGLRKTKRIAGGDKSGRFMGSDFTYADLSSRPLDRYAYTLMRTTEVAGVPVWQVEAIPDARETDETGYTRSILFVRQDNHVVVRAVHWLEKGQRLKYMEVRRLERIDGVFVPVELTMTTRKGESTLHSTVIRLSDVRFDQGHDDQLFTLRRLEQGL